MLQKTLTLLECRGITEKYSSFPEKAYSLKFKQVNIELFINTFPGMENHRTELRLFSWYNDCTVPHLECFPNLEIECSHLQNSSIVIKMWISRFSCPQKI